MRFLFRVPQSLIFKDMPVIPSNFWVASRKLTAIMLVFLFLAAQTPLAFADESAPVAISPEPEIAPIDSVIEPTIISEEDPVVADTKPNKLDEESKDRPSKPKKDDPDAELPIEPEAASALSRQSSDVNSANVATGVTQKLTEVDQNSGAFIYDYPITIPPGRNNVQPDVKLNYNSQNTEDTSVVGYGWSLNAPSINRVNKRGTDQLYIQNDFISSMSGELVDLGSGSYGSKVENGEFLKYTFTGNAWTVVDKSGTVFTFGSTESARQDNAANTTQVFKWMLQEVRDTHDNYVKYEYYKDAGQIYPSRIVYTGNGSVDGIFEVNFLRSGRADAIKSYRTGFLVQSNFRITEINTTVNSSWVRKYTLAYTTGDNGMRSMLASITESGRDDALTISTLPTTTFTYQTSTPGWDLNNYTWTVPMSVADKTNFIDINSDSHVDIMNPVWEAAIPGYIDETYVNTTNNGWVTNAAMASPLKFVLYPSTEGGTGGDSGVRVVDINGDQYPDVVKALDVMLAPGIYDAYINNSGSGWSQSAAWIPSLGMTRVGATFDYGGRVLDLNGDGLADWTLQDGNYNATQINTGYGFSTPTNTWNTPHQWDFRLAREADVNNDGLVDMMYSWWNSNFTAGENNAYLNNGLGGWEANSSLGSPVKFGNNQDFGVRFLDVNGDNLVDVVVSPEGLIQQTAYLNKGTGWVERTDWNLPSEVRMTNYSIHSGDFNQDGLLDFMRPMNNPGTPENVWLHRGVEPDLLSRITTPQGGYTDITYQKTAQYKDVNGNLLNPNLPINLTTAKTVSVNDGAGLSATSVYSYEGGKYYYNGPFDRKLSGFARIKKTDSAGNVTTFFFHQGDGSDSTRGEYVDEGAKIGKVYRTESTNYSGALFAKTISKWDSVTLSSGRKFVQLAQTVASTYDGDTSHKDSAESYTYDSATGNVIQKTEWGEVVGSDDGTFTDTGSDKFTTDVLYAANVGANIVGLQSQSVTSDQYANKVKETKYYYDTEALGTVTKGNLTKQEDWKSDNSYTATQKTYNGTYGTVASEIDARGKITQYTYDSQNLYPAIVTNPLNQATQFTYDYSSGKVKQTTDVNNFVFQNVYDGLDRLLQEKQPDLASPANLVTKTQYVYTDAANANSVKKSEYLDVYTIVDSYTYFDGLGRKVQERIEAEGNNFAVKDTVYNNIGLVGVESLPYFSLGSNKTSATAVSELLATYYYDPLWRMVSATNAVGTTTTTFNDWKITTTDANGFAKSLYQDASGRLVQVDEQNGASVYTTTYEYNYLGNLTKITDALGNVRNFAFDGVGRRLSAQDLHAPADATFGTWTYSYDDGGNIIQSVNPNAQTVNYTYDDLGRMLIEDFTGTVGVETTYSYDSCVNGVGKLCSAVVAGAITSAYQYNPHGAVAREVRTIDGVNYQTDYTYNPQGNMVTATNPDNSQFRYNYNNAGQLESTQRKESSDTTWMNVVTNFDYNPQGAVTVQVNSNGTTTTNTYDATKLYRLIRKVTTGPGGGGGGASTTVSFFSAAGDGSISASNASWDTAHDASTGTANSTTSPMYVRSGKSSPTQYRIERGFVPFDTGSLPDSATITDAKLRVYVQLKINSDNDGDDWITITQGSQPSTAMLTSGDYDLAGAVNYPIEGINATERKDITNIAVVETLTFNLNATGRGWVSKTGTTKLALREGHDVLDIPFVGSSGKYNEVRFRTSEYAGTTFDPVLEVTYTDSLPAPTTLQDVSYVYDAVGNITQMVDASGTDTAKTVNYTYDNLHRLLSATATGVASGQVPYTESYTYDAIGNILTKTNGTTVNYVYAGNTGASMANPHAATSIGGVAIAYDANGNITSEGSTSYTWNYDNRLVGSVVGGVTTGYLYDHTDQRIKQASGATFTRYPSKLYNVDNAGKAVKHLQAGENLSLTIENSGVAAIVFYQHTDHLGSQGATTNTIGQLVELEDYFPFGNMRINTQYTGYKEQRKYIGQEYDSGTGLSYLNARYYKGSYGRFLSQDSMFWNTSQQRLQLIDPQSWNSYSYARNNPLRLSDPSGDSWLSGLQKSDQYNPLTYLYGGSANKIADGFYSGDYRQIARGSLEVGVNTVIVSSVGLEIGMTLGVGTMALPQINAGRQQLTNSTPKADKVNYNNTAQKIATDHAYSKHFDSKLVPKPELGGLIKNQDQLKTYVQGVLDKPSAVFRTPGRNIIRDDRLGTVIFDNKTKPTVFSPSGPWNHKTYFNDQVRRAITQNLKK